MFGAGGSAYVQTNRDRILSDAIPELALPVGANSVTNPDFKFGPNHNFDMQATFENGWPSTRPSASFGASAVGEWHHSDCRVAAYTFTYKLFDEIVSDGNLK